MEQLSLNEMLMCEGDSCHHSLNKLELHSLLREHSYKIHISVNPCRPNLILPFGYWQAQCSWWPGRECGNWLHKSRALFLGKKVQEFSRGKGKTHWNTSSSPFFIKRFWNSVLPRSPWKKPCLNPFFVHSCNAFLKATTWETLAVYYSVEFLFFCNLWYQFFICNKSVLSILIWNK